MKLLVTLLLISLPAYCFGIKCYQCFHSNPAGIAPHDPTCRDTDATHLKDCTEEIVIPTGLTKYFKGFNISTIAPNQDKQTEFSCMSTIAYGDGQDAAICGCIAKTTDQQDVTTEQGLTLVLRVCNTDGCNADKLELEDDTTTPGGDGTTTPGGDGTTTPGGDGTTTPGGDGTTTPGGDGTTTPGGGGTTTPGGDGTTTPGGGGTTTPGGGGTTTPGGDGTTTPGGDGTTTPDGRSTTAGASSSVAVHSVLVLSALLHIFKM